MPWMVDQRHYLDVLAPEVAVQVPAPARRIANFFGSIVQGLTAGWDDPTDGCALTSRCIGKIGRRRCPDRAVARVLADGYIEWLCLTCGEDGFIHHWEDTPWNLTGRGNDLFPKMDVIAELEMSVDQRQLLLPAGDNYFCRPPDPG